MKIEKFEDLEIWREAINIVEEVYNLTREKKFNQDFSLRDQLRKSAISIVSNISEGFERNLNSEFKRFLLIAKGSAGELRAQLYIAFRLGYISQEFYSKLKNRLLILSSKISKLINYLKKKIKQKN